MKKDFIIENKGQFKILQNATRIGGFVVGDGDVATVERVLPERRFAHMPTFPIATLETPTRTYAYFHWRGYILAAYGLRETDISINYRLYKLMRVVYPQSYIAQRVDAWLIKKPSLDRDYLLSVAPTQLKGLETKFLNGEALTEDEKYALKLYFLNTNNFHAGTGTARRAPTTRVWWATRTHLWAGRLRDGLKITEPYIVPGVPKDQDTSGRYHHILGCFVWKDVGAGLSPTQYKMITEEQVITMTGLPQVFLPHVFTEPNANFRVLLNIYQSLDAENWSFVSTYAEDTSENPVKEVFSIGSLLRKYIYKDPVYDHQMNGIPTNLPVTSDRPMERHYKIQRAKSGGQLEALGGLTQLTLYKYLSSDGLNWQFYWTRFFNKGIQM